jgi:hypothetical protein
MTTQSQFNLFKILAALVIILLLTAAAWMPQPALQADDPNPPDHVVKLIFIHHSTGENWLTDGYGNLGRTLDQNNYFVSDTNYGWGPDSIGDRTDIPNWTEWFTSGATPTYMQALFTETGQNSSYTRTLSNPGGENEIIMFKSCFPNSALEGNPNDPAGTYEELSVSGAKYVYNTILQYFATRPDKLFVVITAPPLSDGTYANNARAFNTWLVDDWLRENNYQFNNVAVFDFYNILTDKNAHHRFRNGQVEHILGNRNTTAYASGDDHPNERGSQKATEEFIPMLNVFYHRWLETAGLPPAAGAGPVPAEPVTQPNVQPGVPVVSGVIDNFEGQPPAGTGGWESYFQDNTDTRLTCQADSTMAHAGSSSLQFQFDAAVNSWATCGFYFDSVQNWSAGQGISFFLRSDHAGIPLDVDVYGGNPGAHSTYVFHTQTPAESVNGWAHVGIPWAEILRAEWEENAGSPINPAQVTGFSVGFSTPETERVVGTIWLDELSLLGTETSAVVPAEPPAGSAQSSSVIDDFESGATGWVANFDSTTSSNATCGVGSGTGRTGNSLQLNFNISANSWGICAHEYGSRQDWSAFNGLSFYYVVDQAGIVFDVDLYAGSPDATETYVYTIEAPAESAAGWIPMELRWEDFHRADWETGAGAAFAKTNEVLGLAFGMNTPQDAPNAGSFRVDDITLLGAESAPVVQPEVQPPAPTQETERRGLGCGGATVVPIALIGFAFLQKKTKSARQ